MRRVVTGLYDRRALVMATLALPFARAASAARLAPMGTDVKSSAIRWQVAGVGDVHGFMAVPDRARGRQPAVLIVGDRATSGDLIRATAIATAQAGFVACAPAHVAGAIADAATLVEMRGSARWLASNRYATGRVGAMGFGAGADICAQLLGAGDVSAAILFSPPSPTANRPELLSFASDGHGAWREVGPPGATDAFPGDWQGVWSRATTFLRDHLL